MILRSLIAALATAVLAAPVQAMPLLKGEVVITAAVVTVGDMFDAPGTLAGQALFRAPAPGTTGSVPLSAVAAAAARIGITDFDANGLNAVSVMRQASVIDQAVLTNLITQDLTQRGIMTTGMGAQLQFSAPLASIEVASTATPATLLSLRYLPLSGEFTARFALTGIAEPLDVSGSIDLTISAPHLAAHLAAGTVLTPADIVMKPVSARYADAAGLADPSQLIGKQLNRQSRDGMLLKASDVSTPSLIARNDLVTIYFRQGPMTLTVKGQALTNAVTGAPVQVLNLMSKRVITAKALAAGAVEVSTDPLAIAGL